MNFSPTHQTLVDRFTSACQADPRVVAAFLGGSYASGQADAWSDIDFGLITTDDSHAQFLTEREAFVQQLGSPAFIEDFGHTNTIFFIFPDGTDAELGMGRESDFLNIHSGPYIVLLDKTGILNNAVFPFHEADPAEQHETLRRLIYWFWHDLTHLVTALGRNQLWWAYGQIDELRAMCINLARLHHNFSAPVEDYDKIEKAVPLELLMPLQLTFCPMERTAMLQAGFTLVQFYRSRALPLARAHAIPYPESLERALVERLKALSA